MNSLRLFPFLRRRLGAAAALALLALPALAAPVAPVEIVDAEFGLFDVSNARETVFTPTRVVPLKPGQRYGWIIDLKTRLRSVSVREEYLLPSPVKASGPSGDGHVVVIPLERHNQVSQRQLVPQKGQIIGEWEIGPAEPPGRRHLQVVVEGKVAADFEYDVR